MFEKLPYPSVTSVIFSHIERVTTHYQTLQTWIGLNVTRYHSLNALPHALPNKYSEICLVFGLFATRYHALPFLNISIYSFIYLMVMCGNALQIARNHAKLKENVW